MNENDYEGLIEDSYQRRKKIHKKKNNDYAGEDEVLGNFKRVAIVLDALGIVPNCTADRVALIYQILKIDRYCNLTIKSKTPANESVQDTIDDLKNYVDLMEGCFYDQFQ